ncbi:MAG: uroporphyrinogen-III synthase [Candidatus Gracilibacteria bacterium]|nr:uroporphyrinogen-III synthase [Candidatus Gracilibacteria bacterium]
MQNKVQIISARKLDISNIEEAKKKGIDIFDFDFVQITYIKDNKILDKLYSNEDSFVFTSIHAINAIDDIEKLKTKKAYCIGGKTSLQAEKRGFEILGTGDNALELAKVINKTGEKKVCHLASNPRRNELYNYLESVNVQVETIEVYQKQLKPIKVDFAYDAILFFSPSQVEAFLEINKLPKDVICFCIGETTASYLKQKCTNKIIVSKKHSEEAMLKSLYDYYKINEK